MDVTFVVIFMGMFVFVMSRFVRMIFVVILGVGVLVVIVFFFVGVVVVVIVVHRRVVVFRRVVGNAVTVMVVSHLFGGENQVRVEKVHERHVAGSGFLNRLPDAGLHRWADAENEVGGIDLPAGRWGHRVVVGRHRRVHEKDGFAHAIHDGGNYAVDR